MSRIIPMVRLGDVIDPVARPEAPIPGKMYRQIGVKLWGEGAYEREPIDGGQTKYAQLFRAEAGDVIVNKIWARNGTVAVVSNMLAGSFGSSEFPMFTARSDRVDSRWLHWLTKTPSFWEQCDLHSRGTSGQNRIRPERFLEIEIPLPGLEEQRRILTRIEELAAQIEEARALRRTTFEGAETLFEQARAGVFERARKRGTQPLSMVASLERGKFSHRPRNDPRFFGGDHPWIQIGEIEGSNKYITEWRETLNDDGLAISKKFPTGTVLVSIAATIGAVGILTFDCCIPDSIVGVTPKPDIDSEFLYHYLGYIRTHLESIAPQSAQKNVNLQILAPLPVPDVSLPEQQRIVAELDALRAEVDQLKHLQAETAVELNALLPSVLNKAFDGEI